MFHLASPASPIDYLRLPLHTLKVGSYGTHNALGLAKRHRARFLLASTSEVYGDPQEHPQSEAYWGHVNPIGPRGVYDEAKRYAEALTMAYHRQQGVDTHIVRIFNTYGPRMRPHDGRAIPTFVRQALHDVPITVFGEGQQTRSFCFVSDLIEGFLRLINSDHHEPVNIGNPGEFTILELAETIIRLTGSSSTIVYDALPQDDPAVRRPDITLARDAAGLVAHDRARRGPAPDAGRHGPRGPGRPLSHSPSRRTASSSGTGASPRSTASTWRSRPGECFGVLGPNGAGKTTTMRMLSCLAPRDAGDLRVLGIDPRDDPRALKRLLGVVAQETTLDLELTVRENLLVYARYFDIPRAQARARARSTSCPCSPSTTAPTTPWTSCRAACAGASRSPGRSSTAPGWCCWTSPPPGSTPRPATRCGSA